MPIHRQIRTKKQFNWYKRSEIILAPAFERTQAIDSSVILTVWQVAIVAFSCGVVEFSSEGWDFSSCKKERSFKGEGEGFINPFIISCSCFSAFKIEIADLLRSRIIGANRAVVRGGSVVQRNLSSSLGLVSTDALACVEKRVFSRRFQL